MSASRPAPVELSSITKTPSVSTFSSAGQWIQYTVTVVNSGNAPAMQPVTVTDSRADASGNHPTCTIGEIPAHGASGSCVINYQVTDADVAAGSITDTVTADYHQEGSEQTLTSGPVTVTHQATAAIGLTSSAGASSFSAAGQELTYSYDVANDGDQPLADVSVADTVHGTSLDTRACHWSHLGVATGNFVHCTASYHVTPADVTRGFITNGAVATGTVEGTGQHVTRAHHTTIHLARIPAIGLTAEASTDSFAQAGQDITYTQHGQLRPGRPGHHLHLPRQQRRRHAPDRRPGRGLGAGRVPRHLRLRPGGAERGHLDELSAGHVSSTVTARGRTAAGREVLGTAALRIPVVHAPGLSVLKTAGSGAFSRAGDRVEYFYQVTNTGPEPVAGITVTDSRLRGVSCPLTELAPGEHMVCTASGVITAADVARGSLANVARVRGTVSAGRELGRATMAIVPATRIAARFSPFLRTVPVTG